MDADTIPWRRLFDASPTAISVVDPFGRQIACNQAYADMLGYEIDELINGDIGLVTRADEVEWTASYLTQLASGELDRFATDKVYVHRDGFEFTARLSASAYRDDEGHCSMLIGTIVPIERLPDRQAASRSLLDFISETLTVIDRDGGVIETRGRFAPLLGYPEEFWNNRSILDLLLDDDRAWVAELRDLLLADPLTPVHTEIEVRSADGSGQILRVRATNRLDDPEIGGIVLSTRNITEELRTMSELSRDRETAEAVADAQTRLLATVSHELRNPLHALQGLAELLAGEDLPAAPAELAETLRRQLASLTQVTQDLLDAARLDAGEVVIDPQPTEVAALVRDVAAVGRSAAAEKPLDVLSRVSIEVPEWIRTDGGRLRQALVNLVGNAVKFTQAGAVQVVVRPGPNGSVSFLVIDTGIGIPTAERTAVLEPFRVGSTGGAERGAGLGLSIVQRLVEAMDGRLTMTSEVGVGTQFEISLPLVPAEPPPSAATPTQLDDLTVLVVEDNPVNQQLARSQLERLGIIPIVVSSGEDALDWLDAQPVVVDVILMDHQLPGISGIETTRRIRERTDDVAAIPVLGLSASASASDADAFLAAGMDSFIAKPASLDDLATAIARAHAPTGKVSVGDAAPSERADPDDAASVDAEVLFALGRELGDEMIVVTLVETFLGELDDRVEGIEGGSGDAETRRRSAHTLKSSAQLLGAVSLAEACRLIEGDQAEECDVGALADQVRTAMLDWLDQAREGSTP